ncbi:YuzF family protein [Bacillus sp. DX4.1]|uniref:YuzF family protein n=1 Tax=Bacillus sp. DX4.1 TaxID=3055867 RepID=UPI0025A121A7|nr:YuzF family protein [Bacillus sp. DX4.1]MDM5189116.1 YuzF family protein [Bacillus sp. DX4.1]
MDYSYEDVYGYFRDGYEISGEVVALVDPYLVQILQSIIGKNIVVETIRGSIRGILRSVRPDHIELEERNTPFFVRTQQIVWVMPE